MQVEVRPDSPFWFELAQLVSSDLQLTREKNDLHDGESLIQRFDRWPSMSDWVARKDVEDLKNLGVCGISFEMDGSLPGKVEESSSELTDIPVHLRSLVNCFPSKLKAFRKALNYKSSPASSGDSPANNPEDLKIRQLSALRGLRIAFFAKLAQEEDAYGGSLFYSTRWRLSRVTNQKYQAFHDAWGTNDSEKVRNLIEQGGVPQENQESRSNHVEQEQKSGPNDPQVQQTLSSLPADDDSVVTFGSQLQAAVAISKLLSQYLKEEFEDNSAAHDDKKKKSMSRKQHLLQSDMRDFLFNSEEGLQNAQNAISEGKSLYFWFNSDKSTYYKTPPAGPLGLLKPMRNGIEKIYSYSAVANDPGNINWDNLYLVNRMEGYTEKIATLLDDSLHLLALIGAVWILLVILINSKCCTRVFGCGNNWRTRDEIAEEIKTLSSDEAISINKKNKTIEENNDVDEDVVFENNDNVDEAAARIRAQNASHIPLRIFAFIIVPFCCIVIGCVSMLFQLIVMAVFHFIVVRIIGPRLIGADKENINGPPNNINGNKYKLSHCKGMLITFFLSMFIFDNMLIFLSENKLKLQFKSMNETNLSQRFENNNIDPTFPRIAVVSLLRFHFPYFDEFAENISDPGTTLRLLTNMFLWGAGMSFGTLGRFIW